MLLNQSLKFSLKVCQPIIARRAVRFNNTWIKCPVAESQLNSSDMKYQTEDNQNSDDNTVKIKYDAKVDYNANSDLPIFEYNYDWDYSSALGISDSEDGENETK